jgi:hypothetical protein
MLTIDQKIEAARRTALMRKLEKQELDKQRTDLLAYAEQMKIGVVHIFDKEYPMGGLTVAFRKLSPYDSGVMVEVAVVTCSKLDTFSKKIGTLLALGKFADGETIALPLNTNISGDGLNFDVKAAFSALYFSVN